jgi:hypothetical protein
MPRLPYLSFDPSIESLQADEAEKIKTIVASIERTSAESFKSHARGIRQQRPSHAAGKFGSAFGPQASGWSPATDQADDLYRCSVPVSRIPAIAVRLSQLSEIVSAQTAGAADQRLLLFTMPICCALWAAADITLMLGVCGGWWSLMIGRAASHNM